MFLRRNSSRKGLSYLAPRRASDVVPPTLYMHVSSGGDVQ